MTPPRWASKPSGYAVLVHGGAGSLKQAARPAHEAGCREAADAALTLLAAGASALDAVQRAVEVLEANPRFNAGIGAALTEQGTVELDAAIMEGGKLRAGAVCALSGFAHPIAIARAALDEGRHVIYAGPGAEHFAQQQGFEKLGPEALVTDSARARLEAVLGSDKPDTWAGGTVGAVARDRAGNVAAATSTGGTVGKRPGRVGDSPILGAGTYADNLTGAASATGDGEGILRVGLTARVLADLARGVPPDVVAPWSLQHLQKRTGALGGLILVTPSGQLAWSHTTETMSWAAGWDGGESASGT